MNPKERTGHIKNMTAGKLWWKHLRKPVFKLKKKKSILLAHWTWQKSKFQHVLQPGVSVRLWGRLALSTSLGCVQIATQLCNHSVWILVSWTWGPLPQVCSIYLTAAVEGDQEAAPKARSSADSHGSSTTSTTWVPSLPHTRNHVRTGQTCPESK